MILLNLIPYRKMDLWGFVDVNKNICIQIIFDSVYPFFYNGVPATVVVKNDESFLINDKGVLFYENIYNFYNSTFDIAILRFKSGKDKNNLVKFINNNLEDKFIFNCTNAYFFLENFIIFEILDSNYFGILNFNGDLITNQKFESSLSAENYLKSVGIISKPLNQKVKSKFTPYNVFDYINSNGDTIYKGAFKNENEVVLDFFKYQYTLEFINGIAPVQISKNKWIYINEVNEQVSKKAYYFAYPFREDGIAKVITALKQDNDGIPYNQNNWTGIPNNLIVPNNAIFGYIDINFNEYWED